MIGIPLARLRAERVRRGYTLAALAGRSGVAASTISAVEQLHRNAQPRTVKRLAEALGVRIEGLISEERAQRERDDPSSSRNSGSRAALLRLAHERARREGRLEEDALFEVLQEYMEDRHYTSGENATELRKPVGTPHELRPKLQGTPAADAVLRCGR